MGNLRQCKLKRWLHFYNCVTTETPRALIVLRCDAGYAIQFPAIEYGAASVYVVIVVKPEK